jgi:hypothetical protein
VTQQSTTQRKKASFFKTGQSKGIKQPAHLEQIKAIYNNRRLSSSKWRDEKKLSHYLGHHSDKKPASTHDKGTSKFEILTFTLFHVRALELAKAYTPE